MNTIAQSTLAIFLAIAFNTAGAQAASTPTNDEAQAEALSRPEVLADLLVWQRAGMPGLTAGDSQPDMNSSAYREAHARYVQLRNSAEFVQIVARIAKERGEAVKLATK